jgi:HD-like signal output (HDOD) protein
MAAPGVGEKVARRIILELKGKLGEAPVAAVSGGRASKPAGPATSGLEAAVEVDPDLSSLVLNAGSASFFRRQGPDPRNLSDLIDRIGTAAFRNVTLTALFRGLFAEPLPWYGYDERGLWRHLLGAAVAAWKLGEAAGFHRIGCETLFLGGLLHDIGKPTIQGLLGPDAPPPEVASQGGTLTVLEAELLTVNMTHPELVPLILDIWGVEHDIFPVAEHHHAPQRAGNRAVQATFVQLADVLAIASGLGLVRDYGFSSTPAERVAERLKVPAEACRAVGEELGWTVAEIATAFEAG